MHFAGFWKRLMAYWLDMFFIGILTIAYFYYFSNLSEVIDEFFLYEGTSGTREALDIYKGRIQIYSFLIWILFSMVMDCSAWQGTLGKKIINIRVVDIDGDRISFGRSFARNIIKIISILPLGLGFLWVLISGEKQGWHDIVSLSFVIDEE